jgi:hypothetical protein
LRYYLKFCVNSSLDRFALGQSRLGSFAATGATLGPGDPVWVFLGLGRLAAKTPGFERWKSLDFLGFSRPDRAFSMGYAGFLLKEISSALLPPRISVGTAAHDFGLLKGTDWSWGKHNQISDFLQEIAAGAVSFCRLDPKATRSTRVAQQGLSGLSPAR